MFKETGLIENHSLLDERFTFLTDQIIEGKIQFCPFIAYLIASFYCFLFY